MFLGRISYCMPNILENDGLVVSYKLPILDVVKSLGFHSLVIYFLFWHFSTTTRKNSLSERFQSRYAWDQSFPAPIPAKKRFKSRFYSDPAPNLVLNLSWSYLTSIPVLLLSRFDPALALILSRPYLYSDSIAVLSQSQCYPGSILAPIKKSTWSRFRFRMHFDYF
jgi:hypothetical protein